MKRHIAIIMISFVLLAACGQQQPPPAAETTAVPVGAQYPYPYPAPEVTEVAPVQGPAFTIDAPVTVASGQISGSGPAGVPIRVVNVTRGAEDIALVTIGEDGRFSADISGRVTAGDRVGLMLGDISGTRFSRDDFLSGPGYDDIPTIGIIFTSVLVE